MLGQTILQQYLNEIANALTQLNVSHTSILEFQSGLAKIIKNLKTMANEAKEKLQKSTHQHITDKNNLVKLRDELDALLRSQADNPENISDIQANRIGFLTDKIYEISNNNFEMFYLPKISALTKYMKSTFRIMDLITKNLEQDKNEIFIIGSEIRERLIKLKQHIDSKVMKQIYDISMFSSIIATTQTKVDQINLKINDYNVIIDSFNNVGESLKLMNLSYINSSRKNSRLYFINVDEFLDKLKEYGNYDEIDDIKREIEEYFLKLTQFNLPLNLIKIESPDLNFISEFNMNSPRKKSDDDDDDNSGSTKHIFDLNFVMEKMDVTVTEDLPAGVNSMPNGTPYEVQLTNEDWNDSDVNIRMVVRYYEQISNLFGFHVNYNAKNTTEKWDIYINADCSLIVSSIKKNLNVYISTEILSEEFPPTVVNAITEADEILQYTYPSKITMKEALLIAQLSVNGYDPRTYVMDPNKDAFTVWKDTMVTNNYIPMFIITNSPRSDIEVVTDIKKNASKKRKLDSDN
ncbi:hypothetical protein CsNV_075 [Callinectes sapidus nudivirus]|nr:hypothetical protein CsNV_075 [Callinectes sapidus nudivirus]